MLHEQSSKQLQNSYCQLDLIHETIRQTENKLISLVKNINFQPMKDSEVKILNELIQINLRYLQDLRTRRIDNTGTYRKIYKKCKRLIGLLLQCML